MNYSAIYHEATSRYCYAAAPGRFVFRLQVGRGDLRRVTLYSQDKYISQHRRVTPDQTPMHRVASSRFHDYYEAELCFNVVCLRYYFKLEDWDGTVSYYANSEFMDSPPTDIDRMFDCPQTLREEECFTTPAWAHNAVVYQIFPNRFAASKPVADSVWYKAPIGPMADLKGDLRGIIEKLDYLAGLGVQVLYMTPIFRSNSRHKYDTVDYYTIDPSFGTEADLIELVQKAHARGLRVVLDGVFNHTSPDFFAFADLKQKGEASPYKDWYYCDSLPPKAPLGKANYKCFGYYFGMPKLNQQNPAVARYFTEVALYWLRTAHIDGWRLDVADEIGHSFWKQFRTAIKAEFPDALIVGEVWHHSPDFLQGDEWDSAMNYPFCNAVLDLVAYGTIGPKRFLENLGFLQGTLHKQVYPVLWNLIGSHDTPRLLHRCGENLHKQRLAAALQLLLPGMPMIYYGDEVGMTGAHDPDCRRGMLWDERRQNTETLAWYKTLLAVRRANPALTEGALITEVADDEKGLIWLTRAHGGKTLTTLFHTKGGQLALPQHAGKQNLLTGKPFAGTLGPWQTAVLVE
ncbi:MAG: alpha amylase N-terminal ig-like domain-containing protein [Faecalibacterium sp.]|nr:alpha amylase N-terminal ig-like domain-containing protein [Faecalibacterium sp.]